MHALFPSFLIFAEFVRFFKDFEKRNQLRSISLSWARYCNAIYK